MRLRVGVDEIVGHEAFGQLAEVFHAFDQPRAGEAARRRPIHHFAADVEPAIRPQQTKAATLLWLHVDREAEEILLAEGGIGQRLPHFLSRRSDVGDIDRLRLELRRIDHR